MPIKLKSSDGEVFDVDIEVAKASVTIKTMLEDLGVGENNDEIVPLPNVNSTILKKGKCCPVNSGGCACVSGQSGGQFDDPAEIRSLSMEPESVCAFRVIGMRFVLKCVRRSPLFLLPRCSIAQTHRFSLLFHAVLLWANYHKNDPPIVEVSILDILALAALISPASQSASLGALCLNRIADKADPLQLD